MSTRYGKGDGAGNGSGSGNMGVVHHGSRGGGVSLENLKSVKQFDQVLTDFKRLNAKAMTLIEDYQAKTPR